MSPCRCGLCVGFDYSWGHEVVLERHWALGYVLRLYVDCIEIKVPSVMLDGGHFFLVTSRW